MKLIGILSDDQYTIHKSLDPQKEIYIKIYDNLIQAYPSQVSNQFFVSKRNAQILLNQMYNKDEEDK